VSPSAERNMARVLEKPEQRRGGEAKPREFSPAVRGAKSRFSPIYRALTHKMRAFYNSYFGTLRAHWVPIQVNNDCRTSTHSCLYIYRYRDSTHLFTVKAPTLLRAHPPISDRVAPGSHRNSDPSPVRSAISTVLSPTFLPFFQSLGYRSSNHGPTVRLPTKELGTTVLSPTKSSVKRLNFHESFTRKDVFKRCIKKTSGLMRLFLILVFFSSEWRASN